MSILGRIWNRYRSNFRNNPNRDGTIYLVVVFSFFIFSGVSLAAPWLVTDCDTAQVHRKKWGNPAYIGM